MPWVSPVRYAPASYRDFFGVSRPGARHSQNIGVRPDIAIVIFDSTVPIGTGRAVYMAARAEEVTAAGEVERGMAVFIDAVGHSGRTRVDCWRRRSACSAAPVPGAGVRAVRAVTE